MGQRYVGWGTAFLDVDLDGWEDLFIANGHATRHYSETGAGRKQPPVLYPQPRRQVQGRQPADRQLPRHGPPGARRGLRRPGQRRPHGSGHQPHQRAGGGLARHWRPGLPLAGRAAHRRRLRRCGRGQSGIADKYTDPDAISPRAAGPIFRRAIGGSSSAWAGRRLRAG